MTNWRYRSLLTGSLTAIAAGLLFAGSVPDGNGRPKEIVLEGAYPGHLQDVWFDGTGTVWWAHTHQILKTDLSGRILARAEVEGHNAGCEVADGVLYVAVCEMQGKTGGKTTADCRVQVNEYDAGTLKLLKKHVVNELNDRSGSLCRLADGTWLVGCLRPQDIASTQVRFHHLDRGFRPLSSHLVDGLGMVRLGIEVIKRRGDRVYLFMYGGPTVCLDAKTFAEVGRYRSMGGEVGFAFDGESAYVGKTRRDPSTKAYSSRLVRKPLGWVPSGERKWPFITIRQTSAVLDAGEKFREIIAVNARHPGSADEFWLSFCAGRPVDETAARLSGYDRFTPALRRAGIAVGCQQGVTLGHGDSECVGDFYPEDARQVDRAGRRLVRRCPRSPFMLKYEADLVEAAVRTVRLESVWLDDDLRMTGGAEGCFCERCIGAFNAEYGLALTREELVRRLDSETAKEPLREQWRHFKNKTLALFAAAARRGADRVDPGVRLGYQSVDANYIDAGENYLPLMRELAGGDGRKSAIRVGSGNYFESIPGCFVKMLSVAREAERCRRAPFVAQISYEQETYTREVLHKSAEAVMIESAMALAAGADALTEYWWTPSRDEPTSYYEEFAETVVAWRPYLEALAAVSRRTSLGGIARYRGGDFLKLKSAMLNCKQEQDLAAVGIPVTVFDARQGLYFVTQKTMGELAAADLEELARTGAVVDAPAWEAFGRAMAGRPGGRSPAGKFVKADLSLMGRRNRTLPTHDERIALLDAIDSVRPLPVRIDRIHPLYVYPRITDDGRVAAVTLVNGSIGRCPKTVVRIRRPASGPALWRRPGVPPVALAATACPDGCEVTVPPLPGSNVGTITF